MTHKFIEIVPVTVGELSEKDFLSFPKRLYSKTQLMQVEAEEKLQLRGQHPLSPNYRFQAYNGYCQGEMSLRVALIVPHQSSEAYLGYFESVDDPSLILEMIKQIVIQAREWGAKKISGPVQASFWLGYRMKMTAFAEAPFTGEPHNPSYYPKLWAGAGFKEKEYYRSNFYQSDLQAFNTDRMAKRYEAFIKEGYEIVSPKAKDWARDSLQVFHLLQDLYKDFPIYETISEEQFKEVFASYQYILDFSMVKLAYKEKQLVGFFISLPDYGNLVYQKLTLLKKIQILLRRWRSKRYIVLYLGVAPKHLGLGLAMSYPIFQEVKKRGAQAIGALIHQGAISDQYGKEVQAYDHLYCLWEMDLEEEG